MPVPNWISSAWSAAGLIVPRKVARTAWASFPGITRGMMKLTVSAAHNVTRNRPSLRVRYLIVATAEAQVGLGPAYLSGGVQVRQYLAIIRERIRRRLGILIR